MPKGVGASERASERAKIRHARRLPDGLQRIKANWKKFIPLPSGSITSKSRIDFATDLPLISLPRQMPHISSGRLARAIKSISAKTHGNGVPRGINSSSRSSCCFCAGRSKWTRDIVKDRVMMHAIDERQTDIFYGKRRL